MPTFWYAGKGIPLPPAEHPDRLPADIQVCLRAHEPAMREMVEACPDLPPGLKRESGAIIQAFTEFMCAPAPSANVPQWTLYDSPRQAGAKVPYTTWLLVKLSFFLKDPRLATRLARHLQAAHRQPAPEQPARAWDTSEDVIQLHLGDNQQSGPRASSTASPRP
jgi:hypothetical protein